MTYVTICIALVTLICGGIGGYFLGRYQAELIETIKNFERERDEPKNVPATPTVTMGEYTPPREISTTADDRKVGLVESKTPERLSWENEQAVEKEVLGR